MQLTERYSNGARFLAELLCAEANGESFAYLGDGRLYAVRNSARPEASTLRVPMQARDSSEKVSLVVVRSEYSC